MEYKKPELDVLENALEAVQGINKGSPFVMDSQTPHLPNATQAAYETDE